MILDFPSKITPIRGLCPSNYRSTPPRSLATCYYSRHYCRPLHCKPCYHRIRTSWSSARIGLRSKQRTQCSVENHCSSKYLLWCARARFAFVLVSVRDPAKGPTTMLNLQVLLTTRANFLHNRGYDLRHINFGVL